MLGDMTSLAPDVKVQLHRQLVGGALVRFLEGCPQESEERQRLQSALECGLPNFRRPQRKELVETLAPHGFELHDFSGDERDRRRAAGSGGREGRSGRGGGESTGRMKQWVSIRGKIGSRHRKSTSGGGGGDEGQLGDLADAGDGEVGGKSGASNGKSSGRGGKKGGTFATRAKGAHQRKKNAKPNANEPWNVTDGSGKTGANIIEVEYVNPKAEAAKEADGRPSTEGATAKSGAPRPPSPVIKGPVGRGRTCTLPAWMQGGASAAAGSPSITPGATRKDASESPVRAPAGRGKPLPSWMTKGKDTPPSVPQDPSPSKSAEGPDPLREFLDETERRKGGRVELRRRAHGKGDARRQCSRSRSRSLASMEDGRNDDAGNLDERAGGAQNWDNRPYWRNDSSGSWGGRWNRKDSRWKNWEPAADLIECALHGIKRSWECIRRHDAEWICRPESACNQYIGGSKDPSSADTQCTLEPGPGRERRRGSGWQRSVSRSVDGSPSGASPQGGQRTRDGSGGGRDRRGSRSRHGERKSDSQSEMAARLPPPPPPPPRQPSPGDQATSEQPRRPRQTGKDSNGQEALASASGDADRDQHQGSGSGGNTTSQSGGRGGSQGRGHGSRSRGHGESQGRSHAGHGDGRESHGGNHDGGRHNSRGRSTQYDGQAGQGGHGSGEDWRRSKHWSDRVRSHLGVGMAGAQMGYHRAAQAAQVAQAQAQAQAMQVQASQYAQAAGYHQMSQMHMHQQMMHQAAAARSPGPHGSGAVGAPPMNAPLQQPPQQQQTSLQQTAQQTPPLQSSAPVVGAVPAAATVAVAANMEIDTEDL
eukprot:TRINITY_DN27984_c0_g3_i1.p1 TRINITY_DN27984_c0_g3~~TRINITY_DN27984_c0_g3_i1.p1  ORF type:complete len:947 (+),score=189.42 TRINITY_DN27984_c0_g3_i1:387-2843(+)